MATSTDPAPAELARARNALATVATWGSGAGNEARLAAVEAFDAIEADADCAYAPAAVPDDDPGLTAAGVRELLTGANRDLVAAADTCPGQQALTAAAAARLLAAAGFPSTGA